MCRGRSRVVVVEYREMTFFDVLLTGTSDPDRTVMALFSIRFSCHSAILKLLGSRP